MSIYFAPALIALFLKLVILAYALKGGRVSIVFLSLIIAFAAHNSIETIGYFNDQSEAAVNVFFRLYYVATTYVILYILLHGLSVSKLESTVTTFALTGIATAISVTILLTDLMIAGQYSIGYTITAIKGPLFWVFSLYLLIALFANAIALLYGFRTAGSKIDSIRCKHSLLALTPVMLVFIVAIIFKIADIGISAVGFVPIATTLFLGILIKTESKHKLSDLRRLLPLSEERQTTNQFMDLLDAYIQNSGNNSAYKDLQAGVEKEIILYSLKKCENNITKTAKMMGLKNRSTLYSMMNRLDLNPKD